MQKGQLTQWTSKYGCWGPLPLVQKGQTQIVGYAVGTKYAVGTQYTEGMQYAVCRQYAVGVNAKRSTHTVDFANMNYNLFQTFSLNCGFLLFNCLN